MSLRGRIVSLTVGAALSVLLLFAIPLVVLEQRSAARDVEQAAVEVARGVADYLSASPASADELEAYVARITARDDTTPVTVVAPDGTTYGPELPGADEEGSTSLPSSDADHDGDREGPFLRQSAVDVDDVEGGRLVRVQVRTSGGPTTVLALASDTRVGEKVTSALLPLAGAAVVLLVIVGLAAELVSRRLVRDLDRTADLADTIAARSAVAWVPEAGPPEVRRVAHALNGLAGRIDELLAQERETVADLSHRLRTPLTALRLDVESLPDDGRRSELEQHVDTLERTLTAIIHQSRRSERRGAARGLPSRDRWWRTRSRSGSRWSRTRAGRSTSRSPPTSRRCTAPPRTSGSRSTPSSRTPSPTPRTAHPSPCTPRRDDRPRLRPGGGLRPGSGFGADAVRRGRSDRGSTGLGLDIARSCARSSGGDLTVLA